MTSRGLVITLIAALLVVTSGAWLLDSNSAPPIPSSVKADEVIVHKYDRNLLLIKSGKPLKQYTVALGWNPRGPKTREGDGRTPEGRYRIDWRNAKSGFHRALHISYPNKRDRQKARKLGVSPGGAIMIHGIKNGAGWLGSFHRFYDWTNGCIAVSDKEIEEIWRVVPNGTPIIIHP